MIHYSLSLVIFTIEVPRRCRLQLFFMIAFSCRTCLLLFEFVHIEDYCIRFPYCRLLWMLFFICQVYFLSLLLVTMSFYDRLVYDSCVPYCSYYVAICLLLFTTVSRVVFLYVFLTDCCTVAVCLLLAYYSCSLLFLLEICFAMPHHVVFMFVVQCRCSLLLVTICVFPFCFLP